MSRPVPSPEGWGYQRDPIGGHAHSTPVGLLSAAWRVGVPAAAPGGPTCGWVKDPYGDGGRLLHPLRPPQGRRAPCHSTVPSSLGESSMQVAWLLISMLLPTPMGLGDVWPWVLGPGRRLNVP